MTKKMNSVVSWGSIALIHNLLLTLNALENPLPTIQYRAKVKQHGTNCGVQVTPQGIQAQGRTQLLTPKADYKGFANWVHLARSYWESLPHNLVVYGEWCGPGVEAGMAVSGLPLKIFAVFAVQQGVGEQARIVYEPEEISNLLGVLPPFMHILPWHGDVFEVDLSSRDALDTMTQALNRQVDAVEVEDPWIKSTFNVSGLGEGVVLYPISPNVPRDPEGYTLRMWKAKGLKHRTAGTKEAVQVDAEVVTSVQGFVELMVTEARLAQGLSIVCDGKKDPRLTGKFLQWITTDTEKESKAELIASNLTWVQVEKAVQAHARAWFLQKT